MAVDRERLRRAGNVGQHERALARQPVEDALRRPVRQVVHAVRDGEAADEGLRRRLDAVHARLRRVQRVERVLAGDRQLQEDEREPVRHARLALRRRTDVDGDVGVHVRRRHVTSELAEVVAEGARQARDEHVVDGGARHVLDLLDER